MPTLSVAEQVGHFLRFYPGPDAAPLLRLLGGELGDAVAREALVALSDGYPEQMWALGAGGRTLTSVASTAKICVDGNRFELLRDLVNAGPPQALADLLTPAELDPATSRAAWLERLTRSRVPAHERSEGEPEFTQTSLVYLAAHTRHPRALDFLAIALEHHPEHPHIEQVLNARGPEHCALLHTARMRHRVSVSTKAAADVAAPPAPRRARVL